MIEIDLIGIGTGNPDHLTAGAVKAMNAADVVLLPRKGRAKADLVDLRRAICSAVLVSSERVAEFDLPERDVREDYIGAVHDWHDAIADIWHGEIAAHLPSGSGRVAFLVWGDPSLYDSTIRIAQRLHDRGLPLRLRVVPGITSVQALTAAHAIPLNALAEPVFITTGRQLRRHGWPEQAASVVVMLDNGSAFDVLDPQGIVIWWGAYLGMDQEALVAGPLADAAPRIAALRAELRARHGWIMDIYLMRKEARD